MSLPRPETPRMRPWSQWVGPAITVLTAALSQWLSTTSLGVPNPPAFLVLSIVFSAFQGGLASGLISAVVAWAYVTLFFSNPGQPFVYTDENLRRVIVWAFTMPLTASMVGLLNRRAARGIVRDITERKRMELRLRVQYAIARALAESSTLAEATPRILQAICESLLWDWGELWSVDRQANVVRCVQIWHPPSAEFPAFAAVTLKTALGRGIGLVGRVWASGEPVWIPDVTKDASFARAAVAAQEGLHSAFAFPIRLGDEILGVMAFFHREIREPDNDLLQMFATIGSQIGQFIERKRGEEEIRKLNQDLARRAVELEAANQELEAFSYSVSHDLRAPLRHVIGFTDLLQAGAAPALDEKSRHYLTTIAESAKRMGTLIDDLLAFSRVGRAEMQRGAVNLEQTVKEALRELRQEIEGRDIVWKLSPLPEAQGDSALLRLVWVNLISNAVKYTRPRPRAEIEIGCDASQDHETVFFIRDNGVGFDMRYVDKLFGVFQRLHRASEFEGTGIGLANVRRIVDRHGGRAWAEGTPDGGATFYFSLPKSATEDMP